MSDREKENLEARVTRLEGLVEGLLSGESAPRARPIRPSPYPAPGGVPSGPEHGKRTGPESLSPQGIISREVKDRLLLAGQSERWLGRIGIGFVILALAFLLKLSFDRGWITPGLRVGAGFGTGLALLVLGLRLAPARRTLEQVLLGGAVAIFYLTGFAGYQLYQLLPFWVAISLMTATTVLSIALSERQDSPMLAMIGVAGGLATPFLLDTGSGNVSALAAYASVVLIGGGVVQFHRGWLPLLGTMLLGGSAVLSVVAFEAPEGVVLVPSLAIVVFWLVCGASPVLRPMLRPETRKPVNRSFRLWFLRIALGWGTAAAVIFLSLVLDLEDRGAGLLLLLLGLLTGGWAYRARGRPLSQWPSGEVSALSVALGWILVASGSTSFLLVLIEAAVLFQLVSRGAPPGLAKLGHGMAVIAGLAFIQFAVDAPTEAFLGFREGALVRLAMLGVLPLLAFSVEKEIGGLYRGAAYLGLLVWFLSEFAHRDYGPQLVSIAWSIQGAAVLVLSIRSGSQVLQRTGLATLCLVAAKLLLFDLAQLDPGWRILMFLGFGVGLLGLAYLINPPPARDGGEGSAS